MKLLLLVSLPLLASTNVTLAKSTLNGGRQNVTDSLDMSPRSLSTVRNLKQDTTAATRHQAENAEERFNPEEFALKLAEEAPAVVGKSRSFEGKHGVPVTTRDVTFQPISKSKLAAMLKKAQEGTLSDDEYKRLLGYLQSHWRAEGKDPNQEVEKWRRTLPRIKPKSEPPARLFKKLNFKKKELLKTKEFREWMVAVEISNEGDAGETIIGALLKKIPEEELATMVTKAQGEAPSDKQFQRLSSYLVSHWKNGK